jgi:hypothetical protein
MAEEIKTSMRAEKILEGTNNIKLEFRRVRRL